MKKNIVFMVVSMSLAVLVAGGNLFAQHATQQNLSKQITQKIEKASIQAPFETYFKQLAKQDPAQMATLILGFKDAYIYNESILYMGINANSEALIICQIDDSDLGTFYYSAHKKEGKVYTARTVMLPETQGFITLFERTK